MVVLSILVVVLSLLMCDVDVFVVL